MLAPLVESAIDPSSSSSHETLNAMLSFAIGANLKFEPSSSSGFLPPPNSPLQQPHSPPPDPDDAFAAAA